MADLFDFITQNNQTKGENMGAMAALLAAQNGTTPQSQRNGGSTPIGPELAKAAAGTSANPATGAPLDLETAMQVYQQNKQITGHVNDDTEQKLALAAQAGQLPEVLRYLPDDGKKLLDKMQKNGNLGFGDAAKLNGILTGALKTQTTLQAQKQQDALTQAQLLQNQGAGNTLQLQNAQIPEQLAAIQRMHQLVQARNGVGTGVLSPGAQAALQRQLSDPMTSRAVDFANATGSAPPAALFEKYMDQAAKVEQPIGLVPAGVETDKDTGAVTKHILKRAYRNGLGGIRVDDGSTMSLAPGSDIPGTHLDPSTFQPTGMKTLPALSAPPVNTKERDAALAETAEQLKGLSQQSNNITALNKSIDEYIKANPNGNRTNSFMGTDHGLALRAMLGDTTGGNLKASSSLLAPQILSAAKGLGRMNQTEFEVFKGALAEPTDTVDALNLKKSLVNQLHASNMQYLQAKMAALQSGMTPGQAEQAAQKAVPLPQLPGQAGPAAGAAPTGVHLQALQWAKQNPNDPRSAAILKRLGTQ